jgi:hypothetical protein
VLDVVLDGVLEELVLMIEVLDEVEGIIEEDDVVCCVDDGGRERLLLVLLSISLANIPLAI